MLGIGIDYGTSNCSVALYDGDKLRYITLEPASEARDRTGISDEENLPAIIEEEVDAGSLGHGLQALLAKGDQPRLSAKDRGGVRYCRDHPGALLSSRRRTGFPIGRKGSLPAAGGLPPATSIPVRLVPDPYPGEALGLPRPPLPGYSSVTEMTVAVLSSTSTLAVTSPIPGSTESEFMTTSTVTTNGLPLAKMTRTSTSVI